MLVKDVIKESKLIRKLIAVGLLRYHKGYNTEPVIQATDYRAYWLLRDHQLWYKDSSVYPTSVEMIEAAIKIYFQESHK